MKGLRVALVCAFLTLCADVCPQVSQLRINELMQSNVDYLMVEKDFPDSWVEIYNPTGSDIDLFQCYLGLDADYTAAWRFQRSATIVPAKGFLLIYCDKKADNLHTDFHLDSGKSEVYLFDSKGSVIDNVQLKKMPAPNVAYGRASDGAGTWQYELTPTPGSSNSGGGSGYSLPEPYFSIEGGIMSDPVRVTVSLPDDVAYPGDTKLYITLDGSEPDKDSMCGDSFSFDIKSSTVIRAKLISDNLPSRSVTHSYIYHPRDTKLPIISIATSDDYLYSEEYGIMSGSKTDKKPNYEQDWRRPVNAEYFDSEGNCIFNQLGETAIAGNASRAYAQKSLKLYANKRFGTKRFYGDFWRDKPDVTEVKSFMLRNGGNNCRGARINDAVLQTIFGIHLETLDWQAYQPVIVYINGVYKGEYGMRERSDEDYVAANYGGLEDIEIVDAKAYYVAGARINTLFLSLYNDYMRDDVAYNELAAQIDVDNFVDALICELFSTNTDYPHNNISMWRPVAENGKWRWILKDIDFIANKWPVTFNMFEYMFLNGKPDTDEYAEATMTPNRIVSHALYRRMLSFPEFRELLADRFAVYLGDFLKPEYTIPLIDSMVSDISDEIAPTFKAYGNMASVKDFTNNISKFKTYFEQRPAIVYSQMAECLGLGSVYPMTVSTGNRATSINGIMLTEGDFDGAFFSDRRLNLCADAEGYVWRMNITHTGDITETFDFDRPEVSVFLGDYRVTDSDALSVAFELIPEEEAAVDIIENDVVTMGIYNINGVKIESLQRGVNIVHYSDGTYRKVFVE